MKPRPASTGQPEPAADAGASQLGNVLGSLQSKEEVAVAGFCHMAADPETTLGELVERLVDVVLNAVSASGVAVAMERDSRMLCVGSGGDIAPPIGSEVDITSGLTGECFRTGQRCRCDDTQSDPRVNHQAAEALGIGSLIVVPVLQYGAVRGIVEAFSADSFFFSAEDAMRLERLGQALALGLLPPEKRQEAVAALDRPEPAPARALAAPATAGSVDLAAILTAGFTADEDKPKAAPQPTTTVPAASAPQKVVPPSAKPAPKDPGPSAISAAMTKASAPAAAAAAPAKTPVLKPTLVEKPAVSSAPATKPAPAAANAAPAVPAASPEITIAQSVTAAPATPAAHPRRRAEDLKTPEAKPEVVSVLAAPIEVPAPFKLEESPAPATAAPAAATSSRELPFNPVRVAIMVAIIAVLFAGGYFGLRWMQRPAATATAANSAAAAEQPAAPAANAAAPGAAPVQNPPATSPAAAATQRTESQPKPAPARQEPVEQEPVEIATEGSNIRRTSGAIESVSAPRIVPSGSIPAIPALNAGGSTVTLSSTLVPPKLVSQRAPTYPANARSSGIGGEVVLRGVVGADGRVRQIEVTRGHPLLRQAAIEAVSSWQYEPAKLNGKNIESPVNITLRFNLAIR